MGVGILPSWVRREALNRRAARKAAALLLSRPATEGSSFRAARRLRALLSEPPGD
jgi:hypothetical protein